MTLVSVNKHEQPADWCHILGYPLFRKELGKVQIEEKDQWIWDILSSQLPSQANLGSLQATLTRIQLLCGRQTDIIYTFKKNHFNYEK